MSLDKILANIAPSWAERRAKARARISALEQATNLYEGAAPGRRGENWRRPSTSANVEIGRDLVKLRDGARDLVRNNPHAARGVQVIASNVVGTGIIPRASRPARGNVGQRSVNRAEDLMKAHFDTTAVDADGLHDLYGLQRLAMRAVVESGEVILRRRRRQTSDGLPLPFQIQVLESDHLDGQRTGRLANGNVIWQGVEMDQRGRRVAYYLHDEHPGGTVALPMRTTSRRVPAEDVIHLYRVDRPGQVRGVPWLAPVMLRLRDHSDYDDAQLMRQKIAACFAVFVEQEEGSGESAGTNTTEELAPGIVEHLPPGKKVSFANPPDVEGYREFTKVTLQAIAAGLGITYEAMTGDLSEVNFSAGRMGWLEMHRNIESWRWHMFVPRALHRIGGWFNDALAVMGERQVRVDWTPPRREMIDPTKEVPAIRDAVRSGQMTPSEMVRQTGNDPADHWAEYESDVQTLRQRGIVLDSDAELVTRTGTAHGQDAGFGGDQSENGSE